MIITPNDILLLEKDMFYLSHDHGSKNPLFVKLEDYSRLGQGKVTYYASGIFTEVASSINFANGLAMDEEKGIVYLASMLSKVIYVFKIKDNYTLEEMKKIPLDVAPDNLTIGSKGEILVGAHPKLFSLKSHMEDHDNKSPFEVLQISDPLGKAEVTTIIANDGSMASGVSVALELDNYLYLGNIFQNHMLRCKR